jgi:hypothetical protein
MSFKAGIFNNIFCQPILFPSDSCTRFSFFILISTLVLRLSLILYELNVNILTFRSSKSTKLASFRLKLKLTCKHVIVELWSSRNIRQLRFKVYELRFVYLEFMIAVVGVY